MAHKGIGIVGIDMRLFHHAEKALHVHLVLVLKNYLISAVAMLFKMTVDNRACHSGPFAANRFAPKDNHPSHDETDEGIDDEAGHGPTSIASADFAGDCLFVHDVQRGCPRPRS